MALGLDRCRFGGRLNRVGVPRIRRSGARKEASIQPTIYRVRNNYGRESETFALLFSLYTQDVNPVSVLIDTETLRLILFITI